jgi:hypothetical protein
VNVTTRNRLTSLRNLKSSSSTHTHLLTFLLHSWRADASRIWVMRMVNFVRTHKAIHLKTIVQHTGTRSAVVWSFRRLCFVRSSILLSHSCHCHIIPEKEKRERSPFQKWYYCSFFYWLKFRSFKLLKSGSVCSLLLFGYACIFNEWRRWGYRSNL